MRSKCKTFLHSVGLSLQSRTQSIVLHLNLSAYYKGCCIVIAKHNSLSSFEIFSKEKCLQTLSQVSSRVYEDATIQRRSENNWRGQMLNNSLLFTWRERSLKQKPKKGFRCISIANLIWRKSQFKSWQCHNQVVFLSSCQSVQLYAH